ncbi:MAG: hypothetical protein Q8N04_12770 [Nitrospira sp.]|nr:hypothetical protein [Nitrospira sp.]
MNSKAPADSKELNRLLKQREGPTLEFKRYGIAPPTFDDWGGSLVVTFRAPIIPGAGAEPRDQVGTKWKPCGSAVKRNRCL